MIRPPERFRCAASRQGFTLLEIMLALAIFAIAVVGVVKGTNLTIRSASMVADDAHAREQINSRLAETKARRFSAGTTRGGPDARGVSCTVNIEPLRLRDRTGRDLPSLYRVVVTAEWNGAEGPQSQTAEEYAYQAPLVVP